MIKYQPANLMFSVLFSSIQCLVFASLDNHMILHHDQTNSSVVLGVSYRVVADRAPLLPMKPRGREDNTTVFIMCILSVTGLPHNKAI